MKTIKELIEWMAKKDTQLTVEQDEYTPFVRIQLHRRASQKQGAKLVHGSYVVDIRKEDGTLALELLIRDVERLEKLDENATADDRGRGAETPEEGHGSRQGYDPV